MSKDNYRHYRIVLDWKGVGGFMCPPGHYNHSHSLWEYTGPRGKREIGIFGLDYADNPHAAMHPELKAEVDAIRETSRGAWVCSEMYVRYVYGHYHNVYSPDGVDRNFSNAVFAKDGTPLPPPVHHLGYLTVRSYFGAHAVRHDLIADPGKGYGNYPCAKCAQWVQYMPRFDKFVEIDMRITSEGVKWNCVTQCPEGGDHHV